jgi:flavin-dependent dehydrogenase
LRRADVDVEVLVLGGGPAGAVAALTLARRNRHVLLADRRLASRQSVGEVLPPAGRALLQALGGDALFVAARHRQGWCRQAAWGGAALSAQDLSFHPYGCAWHLDREAFDADLLETARQAGVAYMPDARLRHAASRPKGGWSISLGRSQEIAAAFVIDATGRASAFARRQGVMRSRVDRLVALLGRVDLTSRTAEDFTMEARPGGWWYMAPLPGGHAIAGYLTDADLVPPGREAQQDFWTNELRRTEHVGGRLPCGISVPVRAVPASTERSNAVYGESWIAVGDAAGSFDPLSSLGLTHAMETGRLAALAVDAAVAGERRLLAAYARFVRRRADEHDIVRRAYYAMERRWPTAPFWARRSSQPMSLLDSGDPPAPYSACSQAAGISW